MVSAVETSSDLWLGDRKGTGGREATEAGLGAG